jgi:prepilin-type N-terminal cleavage/methylation domain-containing protein
MRAGLKARRGFTLLEALVAFAILALALSQLLAGVGGGARSESRADFLLRAARHGASQLDALGADGAIPLGDSTGRYDDGLVWRLTVRQGRTIKGPTGAVIAASFPARLIIERPSGYADAFVLSTVKVITYEERAQ